MDDLVARVDHLIRDCREDSPNTAWRSASFQGYADHMLTEEFRPGIEEFRHRPLGEAGPFTFVAGRAVNPVVLVATGVNGDGLREVLGLRVATSETGAAWNEFFADLTARGLAESASGEGDAAQRP